MPQGIKNHDGERQQSVYPPPSQQQLKEVNRGYRDDAAAALFDAAGGKELLASVRALHRALTKQASQIEQFHSTPFTKRNQQQIITTIRVIERAEAQLERWHYLVYPNQKAKEDQ